MPRPRKHYAEKARRAFLRGTAHDSPDVAIATGCRSNEEWAARLEGAETAYFTQNGRKARRAVQKRHPVAEAQAVQNGRKRAKEKKITMDFWSEMGGA